MKDNYSSGSAKEITILSEHHPFRFILMVVSVVACAIFALAQDGKNDTAYCAATRKPPTVNGKHRLVEPSAHDSAWSDFAIEDDFGLGVRS